MVAGCPKCGARYRVNPDRIGAEGAKLRCTKCSAVFLVRAPRREAAPVAAEVPVPAEAPAQPPVERDLDRTRLVLVADPDEERGKACAAAIESWGLHPIVVHDGVEAMLTIQRTLPRAVVLDAALPKMFGFQVCEVVKRNESLRDTVVVLVGAIHHQDRYRRDPSDLYGADVYIEQPDLPDGLHAVLREGGLPMEGAASAVPASVEAPPPPVVEPPAAPVATEPPAPEPSIEAPAAPEPIAAPESTAPPELELELDVPEAPAPAAESEPAAADDDPEKAEERERALRLARIAVSEMVLYQPEKFERAAVEGNLEEVLDMEIQEARALLRQRVSEEVRNETDFILDELNRVAAERSGRG